MFAKIKEMFGSIRFWLVLIFGVSFLLDQLGIIPGVYARALEIVTGLSVAIRQVDKFAPQE